MKAIFISMMLLFGLNHQVKSQEEVRDGLYFNKGGRQVWIIGRGGIKSNRALLIKVSKDSVFYAETMLKTLNAETTGLKIKSLHYSEIDTLITLKNKPGAKGAVAGGLIGFVAGIVIRAATYDPDPVDQFLVAITGGEAVHSFSAGLLGATAGVAVGAGIGSIAKKKWIIHGQQSNFDENILDLDKRAYWNRSNRPN